MIKDQRQNVKLSEAQKIITNICVLQNKLSIPLKETDSLAFSKKDVKGFHN